MDTERIEAVQAVVDRLTSYQDGATEATVAEELRAGLAEIDVDLSEEQVAALVGAIEKTEDPVDVNDVLG